MADSAKPGSARRLGRHGGRFSRSGLCERRDVRRADRPRLERLKKLCSRLQPGFLSSGEALATESMSAATCAGAEMKPELKKTAPFQRRQTATEFV